MRARTVTKAVVGYTTPDLNCIVEQVDVVADLLTGGQDGHGTDGTEMLTVVRTQWGDLALVRQSTCPLDNVFGTPVTYIDGAKGDTKKLANILRQLADLVENS